MSPGVMAASGRRRNAAAIARWVIRDEGICPRLCAADIARYPPVREAPAYVYRTGEFALPPSGSVRAPPRSACRIARRRGRRFHTPGNPGSSTYAPQIRGKSPCVPRPPLASGKYAHAGNPVLRLAPRRLGMSEGLSRSEYAGSSNRRYAFHAAVAPRLGVKFVATVHFVHQVTWLPPSRMVRLSRTWLSSDNSNFLAIMKQLFSLYDSKMPAKNLQRLFQVPRRVNVESGVWQLERADHEALGTQASTRLYEQARGFTRIHAHIIGDQIELFVPFERVFEIRLGINTIVFQPRLFL